MRLSKDKLRLAVNPSLTLAPIPPEAFDYRLGNRSALEWVIDQYQVSTDKRSGITCDPNREDDPEYIVRLVGQVVRVSIETVKIVQACRPSSSHTKSNAPAGESPRVAPATYAARGLAGASGSCVSPGLSHLESPGWRRSWTGPTRKSQDRENPIADQRRLLGASLPLDPSHPTTITVSPISRSLISRIGGS